MKVVLADSYGMCFGVRDAVEMALSSPHREDLTVLGELVHNPEVLRRIRVAGIRVAPSAEAEVETGHAMVTAHGAARSTVEGLRERGLDVTEATCPLVAHAHRMLDRLVAQGYFPVVIGKPDHVEVRGLVRDLPEVAVLQSEEQIPCLAGHSRLGIVSQTTQPLDFVLGMVDAVRARFPEAEVRFADTVCAPTKERQTAARRLAAAHPVVVVIGGRNSNNTRQLARACAAEGARVHQIERPEDLCPEWFDGIDSVGLTAGTSTPDETIDSVRVWLENLNPQRSTLNASSPNTGR